MIILLCGLSGAGKTTLAQSVKNELADRVIPVEVVDGDEYRAMLFKDLGFSKADRYENMRRLGFLANKFATHGIVAIVSAINPYEEIRAEIVSQYENVKVVFVDCAVTELIERDTKGLYKRALLPDNDPQKLRNFTGISDPFDVPLVPDLKINSQDLTVKESTRMLSDFITENYLSHHEQQSPYYSWDASVRNVTSKPLAI